MNPDVGSQGPLAQRLLQRGAARWWWVPLVAALVWFLLAAVNEGALASMMSRGWAVLHIALSVIFVLGALWAFIRPIDTFFALASVLGLLLFLQGSLTLVRGLAMRDETPHWWLEALSGGLLLVLALWVSTSDRVWDLAGRTSFILLWVGFTAIFRGISDLTLSFSLRGIAKEGEMREAAAGAAASIPPQERREAASPGASQVASK
jgi:uncharacterized membrane protein HdeD (DUF308 family)